MAREETAELSRLRRRVDAIDRRIVRLLNERAAIAIAIGAAKTAGGRRSTRDAVREREVLERVSRENGGPLPEADLVAVYRRVISATRRLQRSGRGILPGPRAGRAARDARGRGTGANRR